jgi:hypothetical protein
VRDLVRQQICPALSFVLPVRDWRYAFISAICYQSLLMIHLVTSIACAVLNILQDIKEHPRWSDITLNMLGSLGLLVTNVFATVSIFYKAM